ncbi:MAG: helix-turn-helix domain-containing protein [Spirochaetales bacterium]|nr:helix-turn-helix domain-containing protein [Spirochaetales bacterium]
MNRDRTARTLFDTPSLRYRLYRPSLRLRKYVRCYWTLEKESVAWRRELMVPDGYVDVIFCFAEGYQRRERNGEGATAITAGHIVGQRTRSVFLTETKRLDLLGIKLRPLGLQALAGIPAGEFYGRIVPLAELSHDIAELEERLYHAPGHTARISLLEAALTERLVHHEPDRAIDYAVGEILRSRGVTPIALLGEGALMSRRTLERRFLDVVGISPKRFARVIRFKATLKHLKEHESAVKRNGYLQFGYYDQNYFIKDFRYFMGGTPSDYFTRRFHSDDEFFSAGVAGNIARWLAD